MPTTISVDPIDPENPAGPQDLDGFLVDGVESLRQRIEQRLRFPLGSWHLDASLGTPSILGHDVTPALAERIMVDAIYDEGGAEVLDVVDADFRVDHADRVLRWSATVVTVYGDVRIAGDAV